MLDIVFGSQKFSRSSEYRKTPFSHFWVFVPKLLTHPTLTHIGVSFPQPRQASPHRNGNISHYCAVLSSRGGGELLRASFQNRAPPMADEIGTGTRAKQEPPKSEDKIVQEEC